MKYLGPILDNKDLVTKQYVDQAVAGSTSGGGGGSTYGLASTAADGLLKRLPDPEESIFDFDQIYLNANNEWSSTLRPASLILPDSSNFSSFAINDLSSILHWRKQSDYTGTKDANVFPENTMIRLASAAIAATWSNIPSPTMGVLICIGDADRKFQIYWVSGGDSGRHIYTRDNHSGNWQHWKEVTQQSLATSWSSVTPLLNGTTAVSGGYLTEGKHVYVQARFRGTAITSMASVALLSGFPTPVLTTPVISVMTGNQSNGVSWIDADGRLVFRPTSSVASGSFIAVNGHYLQA